MGAKTPVLVGIAQVLQRSEDLAEAREPLALMIDAVQRAFDDAVAPELVGRVDSVRVIKGIWGYRNPARAIADSLDRKDVECGLSVLGGNHVQMVVNRSAVEIQEGRRRVVVIAGAECGRTMGRASKADVELGWLQTRDDDRGPAPDVEYGDGRWTRHEVEMARGLQRPVQYYSLFENALRYARGESIDDHLDRISRLWAGFNRVAQENPSAWIRREVGAEEIRTPSAKNRPITFPYTMLMNANMRVDMGAALVLCSLEEARAAGVPEEKLVYPVAGTDACDHYFVSEREDLRSSPAIRLAGGRVLELAETSVDELDFVDLYSCFPSAVQVAARELGLDPEGERPLTVTGGLTFGGGPLNDYVLHSIARTAELLREKRSGRGLVTANGGMLTKHSFGVYAAQPPEHPFRWESLQEAVDATPRRESGDGFTGETEIESYVVMFGGGDARPTHSYRSIYGASTTSGSQPSLAHLACLDPQGRRLWANLDDPEVLDAMCAEEFCGRRVRVDGEGGAVVV